MRACSIFFFPFSLLTLLCKPLPARALMNFFTFWGKIVTDPIAFSTFYFKERALKPKAKKLYFAPNLIVLVAFLLLMLGVSKETLTPEYIIGWVMFALLGALFLVTNFVMTRWLLRTAIRWSGFEVKKKEADELSLYLMAHTQALFLCLIMVGVIVLWITFLAFIINPRWAETLVVFSICITPLVSMRRYYVHYRLVQRWSDAYPMDTIVSFLFLRFLSLMAIFVPLIMMSLSSRLFWLIHRLTFTASKALG